MTPTNAHSKTALTTKAMTFMQQFGLAYPIIQAAPGGEQLATAQAMVKQCWSGAQSNACMILQYSDVRYVSYFVGRVLFAQH
jgi:hypothetical protein